MGSPRYSNEFKLEAVGQILERGYSVKEVAERIGVSTHSLYKWLEADPENPKAPESEKADQELEVENARPKSELRRVQEERDIFNWFILSRE